MERIWEDRGLAIERKTSEALALGILIRRVDQLPLATQAINYLRDIGIEFVWQLLEINEKDLLKKTRFNRERLYEIKKMLDSQGLWLGMGHSLQGWHSFQKENLAEGAGMEEDAPL